MLETPLEIVALVHAFGLPTLCTGLKIPNLTWTRRTVLHLFFSTIYLGGGGSERLTPGEAIRARFWPMMPVVILAIYT